MIASSILQSALIMHILQFSTAITVVALLVWMLGRRWPEFTFLVCMLALVKSLVPPVIASPAGLFTQSWSLAYSPQLPSMGEDQAVQLKQLGSGLSEGGGLQAVAMEAMGFPAGYGQVFLTLVVVVWLVGICALLLRAGAEVVGLLRMVANASPAPGSIERLTSQLQEEMGISCRVRILISQQNFGPACIGLLRPKLILPSEMALHWDERLLRPILAHELVHARRGDMLWGLLQFFAQIVWWFHPLVWWLGRRASVLCERCCDDEVLTRGKCQAGDYAESLVRVLELRNSLQPLPLGRSMSAVDITTQRLERLMDDPQSKSRATRWKWLATALMAAMILPGMQWVTARDSQPSLSKQAIQMRITQSFQQGNWEEAIRQLRPVVEQDPGNANAVFHLGYALHAHGQLDEALHYHALASQFPQVQPIATYNWACALALQGKMEPALEKLEKAIKLGFVHRTQLCDDPDLAALLELPKFQELSQLMNEQRSTQQALAGQLDFLIGNWSIVDQDGQHVADHAIVRSHDGQLIREDWHARGGNSGTKFSYFHPVQKQWRQTWVDAHGNVLECTGEFRQGKMQFNGTLALANGQEMLSRMCFTPNADGSIAQLIEVSEDTGQSWRTHFQGLYRQRLQSVEIKVPEP